jgi:FkbH-like protein
LVNKTNQFNLTTRRTTDAAIAAVMADPAALSLQLRLIDRFGNNGLIAVVMGACEGDAVHITDWVMSCRVLQRGVEDATLALIVEEARRRGARRLVGCFHPTAKNGMVRDLYERLRFHLIADEGGGVTRWQLELDQAPPLTTPIRFEPPLVQPAALEAAY